MKTGATLPFVLVIITAFAIPVARAAAPKTAKK